MKMLNLKYGINTAAAVIIVLGIVVLIEGISIRHHHRIDLTATSRHTLSDQSLKILDSLEQDVKVTGFFSETQRGEQLSLKDLLDQYVYSSPRFSYEFVDPDKNPGKAKKYQVTNYGATVVESEDQEEKIFDTKEEDLINAILKVTRKEKKVIYFLKGHGEKNTENINKQGFSFAMKAIEGSNYEVKDIVLASTETLPDNSDLLIVAGPQKPILSSELEIISNYITGGGRVFFMIDPNTASELQPFLTNYGIDLKNNIVVDKMSRVFGVDPSMPVVTQYGEHPIVKDFSIATFFPLTRSVNMTVNPVKGAKIISILKTSPQSWAETDMDRVDSGEAAFDEGKDIRGPVSIGVVALLNEKKKDGSEKFRHNFEKKKEKGPEKKKARIVVIGDSDFASNSRINILGNSDFFLNVINWLLEEEDLISIRPKESANQMFTLSKIQQKMIFWIPMVVMPGFFITIGIAVYKKRKNMR